MPPDKFCPYCGKQNKVDTQFCIQCNKDFIMIPYTKREYFIYGVVVIVLSVFIFSVGILGDRFLFLPPLFLLIGIVMLILGLRMKSDSKCPKCGVDLPPDAAYCIKCGVPVELVSKK
jgi:hypothetical protein